MLEEGIGNHEFWVPDAKFIGFSVAICGGGGAATSELSSFWTAFVRHAHGGGVNLGVKNGWSNAGCRNSYALGSGDFSR